MDKLFDKILIESYELCATDVHFVVGSKPVFRIDGNLFVREEYISFTKDSLFSLIKSFLSDFDLKVFLDKKDIDISYDIKNITRFRISIYFEKENPCFVARVVSKKIPSLESLKIPDVVKKLIENNKGLVLITGPSGSGKSTTLASLIDAINKEQSRNIITIEDPIEFIHESKNSLITQRQYGSDFFEYPRALKHVVRQDPDVVMVGEMRDYETVSSTISLAESGHLVFSTLHTFSAAQTIDRIIDIFPSSAQSQIRSQLSITLLAVVSQRLIPKIGGGRVIVCEVMLNTPAVSNLIRENKISQIDNIIQTSSNEGMFTMKQDVKRLVDIGVVEEKYLNSL